MKTTRTIELDDRDRETVSRFLKLAEEISDIANCSMDAVFMYLADDAEITEDGYNIKTLHQISDIS